MGKKETETEKILVDFLNTFESQYESTSDKDQSVDARQQNKLKSMKRSLSEVSMLAAQKYMPILKHALLQREEDHLENIFGHIKAKSLSSHEMARNYRQCFEAFISSPDVSFETHNPDLLKNIKIRDQFVLTLWAVITVRRESGDNLLQLICSGESSSGE